MNPLFMLVNMRLIAWVAGIMLLTGSHLFMFHKGALHTQAKWDVAQAQAVKDTLTATQAARAKEQALVQTNNQLEKRYADLKATNEVHAAASRAALKRLSDTLDETNSAARSSAAPSTGIDGAATVESDILRQCATALTDLGANADRLSLQVVGLQSYVVNVCR